MNPQKGKEKTFESFVIESGKYDYSACEEFSQIINSFDLNAYEECVKALLALLGYFYSYRKSRPNSPSILYINQLIKEDKAYVDGTRTGRDEAIASHNAFVLRYVGGMQYAAIAHKMNCSQRVIFKYISRAKARFLILMYGIDALPRNTVELNPP